MPIRIKKEKNTTDELSPRGNGKGPAPARDGFPGGIQLPSPASTLERRRKADEKNGQWSLWADAGERLLRFQAKKAVRPLRKETEEPSRCPPEPLGRKTWMRGRGCGRKKGKRHRSSLSGRLSIPPEGSRKRTSKVRPKKKDGGGLPACGKIQEKKRAPVELGKTQAPSTGIL